MHIDQLALAKSSIKRKTCHTADFGQVWPENDAHDRQSGKVVTQQTMAKCGKNNDAPRWRTLLTADFDQIRSKMCPSLEDFVTQRTLTKCGPKCAPCWRTLSHSGLQLNVAQNVPLIRGLCHAEDFNQMWPKMCPLLEDFVTQRTLTKCGPNMCPLTGDFVLLWGSTTYGLTMYSSLKKAGTKQTDSNCRSTPN